jgi:hypothetical protein
LSSNNEIPESLREGHEAFTQWRDAMAKAGKPLPIGGVFLLNRMTILGDSLSILWSEIVATLRCPPECVKLEIDQDLGGLHHRIKVAVPDEWIKEFSKHVPSGGMVGTVGLEKMIDAYIQSVIADADRRFRENLKDRLSGLEPREDLLPKVIVDVLGQAEAAAEATEADQDAQASTPETDDAGDAGDQT